MPRLNFTEEQLLAIQTKNSDILVAAAAGSGKTAVLVQRIIRIILDKKTPVDIDTLLVVTFTEAAASEMKQRIGEAITNEIEKNPNDEHLQKQLTYLNKAKITTIHSFCLSVIKQNFHLIDIDPSFRIADETEINLLKKEVLTDLFEEEYQRENNESFLNLVEFYGNKFTDDMLQDLILTVNNFINSSPWPEKFLNDSVEMFNISNDKLIDDTPWGKFLKDEINSMLSDILENIKIGENICKAPNGPYKYLDNFYDDHNIILNIKNKLSTSLENLFNLLDDVKFTRLNSISKKEIEEENLSTHLQNRVKNIRNDIKDDMKKIISNFFFKSPSIMKDDIIKTYPMMKSLGELVLSFNKAFIEIKREKNIVDFNDLEHFSLQILLENESTKDNPIPTKKALEIQKTFNEIFIDEYQDSNLIQELILWSVSSRNPNNRFMVGDMKQSIYKFRRANPQLFIEKYESFSDIYNGSTLKIDLSKNFRSRKIILSSINFIFYQLMSREVGEIDYNENQALHYSSDYMEDENTSLSTELHLIEQKVSDDIKDIIEDGVDEYNKLELEANIIGRRINELISGDEKLSIQGKDKKLRTVKFSDIVILVRSIKNSGEIFIKELKKMNIPVFANTSQGFWESIEVLTILSFLQIIDNPIQDLPLLSVLHSPVYSIGNEELLEIRNADKENFFYYSLKKFISNEYIGNEITKSKIKKFLEDLDSWRSLAVHTPISELIGLLYEETDYFNYVGVMTGGLVRQGNLNSLQEKAIQYEKTSYKSLFHFITYIKRLQENEEDSGNVKLISENDNVVKMMTIHKSKGLEFPVVFVSLLGRQLNKSDLRRNLILHSEHGFGPMYINLEDRIKSNTIARLTLSRLLLRENLSEELRILYVALTRAKEKLILTGVGNNISKKIESWNAYVDYDQVSLPPNYLLKATTYLDLIVPPILRHSSTSKFVNDDIENKTPFLNNFDTNFKIILQSHDEALSTDVSDSIKKQVLLEELNNLDLDVDYSSNKESIINNLTFEYDYIKGINLPSNISISEIKRNYYELELAGKEEVFIPSISFKAPNFLESSKEVTSLERGIAIHTVVEHLDLNYHDTTEKIQELIRKLTGDFLTEEDANIIPVYKILNFVQSKIAQRMRNAKVIKKEEPFVMGITPEEAYGNKEYENIGNDILVHGIIDCFFEEDENIILVDYKSDYITEENKYDVIEKYKLQLQIYKNAIEESTNKKVSESLIYFFGLDDTVKVF